MGARLRELATYLCPTTSSFKPVRHLSANKGSTNSYRRLSQPVPQSRVTSKAVQRAGELQ